MGIYIPDMELPEDGDYDTFRIFSDGTVVDMLSEKVYHVTSIPDHGDLIDRDMILKKAWDIETFVDAVKYAPTIIPADPPVMYYPQVPGITPTVITEEGK